MIDFNIFLSGKMTGLSQEEMNGWRKEFAEKIGNDWFGYGYSKSPHVINPCRYEDLWKVPKEFVRWDLDMVKNSDLIVAKISENQDSIGTAMELATAYQCGIPILTYNPHHILYCNIHPFTNELSNRCFDTMDELVDYITELYLF